MAQTFDRDRQNLITRGVDDAVVSQPNAESAAASVKFSATGRSSGAPLRHYPNVRSQLLEPRDLFFCYSAPTHD